MSSMFLDENNQAKPLVTQPSTAPSSDPLYVNPNEVNSGDQGASRVLGRLYRAQWEDWKTRYQPYVERLAALSTDTGFAARQGQMASTAMQTTYDNTAKGLQLQQQSLGANVSPAQRAAQNRKMSVGRAADSAGAFNAAQISARDLQDQILAGGMGLKNVPNTGQLSTQGG
ncbi:hypothetical protein IB234_15345 [Pseudomonas sp. PDM16]|uniref:hypothetical protein n=1 Tax=Pseudomonas sp. PDM16 TaxID=2769292 RepID=UPI0017800EAD|nr:hypothetical protein [Pseudomonas sp. PDM16]MBD9415937.1 hypothetical protein [Pseudomonas sp. PDM16]